MLLHEQKVSRRLYTKTSHFCSAKLIWIGSTSCIMRVSGSLGLLNFWFRIILGRKPLVPSQGVGCGTQFVGFLFFNKNFKFSVPWNYFLNNIICYILSKSKIYRTCRPRPKDSMGFIGSLSTYKAHHEFYMYMNCILHVERLKLLRRILGTTRLKLSKDSLPSDWSPGTNHKPRLCWTYRATRSVPFARKWTAFCPSWPISNVDKDYRASTMGQQHSLPRARAHNKPPVSPSEA